MRHSLNGRRAFIAGMAAVLAAPAWAETRDVQVSFKESMTILRLRDRLRSAYAGHPVAVDVIDHRIHLVFPELMLFDSGSSSLTPQGVKALTAIAEQMHHSPDAMAEIISARRAPDEGFETHITAKRRSTAVMAALESRGVSGERMKAVTLRQSRLRFDAMQRQDGNDRIHVILSPSPRWH